MNNKTIDSNRKSVAEIITIRESAVINDEILERRITLATEYFTQKFPKLILKDRSRLSKESAMTVCEYIIAMKREINPRYNYVRYTIQFLSELSRTVGLDKKFIDMTRDDLLSYLDKSRKPEDEDPLHKWIGSYNIRCVILFRFFKWLYYPNITNPKKRSELSSQEGRPECIMGIPQLRRKEVSCYKPTDLWTQEDDLLFLKWVTNKRDRCYHTMARDLSARPHEILNLKIKDVIFKSAGNKQYAEVLVNGKTGSRHIRRHSALTEKSTKLKLHTLNQHAGWSTNSNMAQKYIHYFGNESSESLLEAYGIVTKDNIPINTLNPKLCPNCNEGNTQDAKFCTHCRMVLTYDAYNETLDEQKRKEDKLTVMEGQFNSMQSQMRALITALGNMDGKNKVEFAKQLYQTGIYETDKNYQPLSTDYNG